MIFRVPEYSEVLVAIWPRPCVSARITRNIKARRERPRVHRRPYIDGPKKSLVQAVPVPVPSWQDPLSISGSSDRRQSLVTGYAGRHEHVPVQWNVSSCDFVVKTTICRRHMTTPAYTAETAPPCLLVGIPRRPPHALATQLH